MKKTRKIEVDYLTRVEGEASLTLSIDHGEVVDIQFSIFEPPRFFEAFLRGRDASEVPDITARICGICPVAYQMSSVHALEQAFHAAINPQIRQLRRLYYCGEWIESHSLHIHMLAAPDFLGCESVVTLAEKEKPAVERGLRIKKAGNAIVQQLGGRAVHPVGARLGGFHRTPTKPELRALRKQLEEAHTDAEECLRWVAGIERPEYPSDIEFVSLRHPSEYPMNDGDIVSTRGLKCTQASFDDYFEEHQIPHSNALHAKIKGRGPYFVGPLARLNLNFDRLLGDVAGAAKATGITWPSADPYVSIVARAVEVLQAVTEALLIIDGYQPPDRPYSDIKLGEGIGRAVTEAPRGMLYHVYETDEAGRIRSARIVPPTSQNQAQMEANLRELVPEVLRLPHREATHLCESAIRNYDPCISCATHFLRLEIDQR